MPRQIVSDEQSRRLRSANAQRDYPERSGKLRAMARLEI
jgi:hypothetical protein